MKISVLTYPDPEAGAVRPHAFHLGGRRVAIVAILDRWQAAGHCYFRVRDLGGRSFVLRRCVQSGSWELEGVYRRAAAAPKAIQAAL
jgi:hypothetical protein